MTLDNTSVYILHPFIQHFVGATNYLIGRAFTITNSSTQLNDIE